MKCVKYLSLDLMLYCTIIGLGTISIQFLLFLYTLLHIVIYNKLSKKRNQVNGLRSSSVFGVKVGHNHHFRYLKEFNLSINAVFLTILKAVNSLL